MGWTYDNGSQTNKKGLAALPHLSFRGHRWFDRIHRQERVVVAVGKLCVVGAFYKVFGCGWPWFAMVGHDWPKGGKHIRCLLQLFVFEAYTSNQFKPFCGAGARLISNTFFRITSPESEGPWNADGLHWCLHNLGSLFHIIPTPEKWGTCSKTNSRTSSRKNPS